MACIIDRPRDLQLDCDASLDPLEVFNSRLPSAAIVGCRPGLTRLPRVEMSLVWPPEASELPLGSQIGRIHKNSRGLKRSSGKKSEDSQQASTQHFDSSTSPARSTSNSLTSMTDQLNGTQPKQTDQIQSANSHLQQPFRPIQSKRAIDHQHSTSQHSHHGHSLMSHENTTARIADSTKSLHVDAASSLESLPVIQLLNFKFPFPFIHFEATGHLNTSNNTYSNTNSQPIAQILRARLVGGNILLLAISLSFVVFTYALCLLIYYKRRYKSLKKVQSGNILGLIQRKSLKEKKLSNISEPFNLQMSPATRTRLNIMLKMIPPKEKRITSKSVRTAKTILRQNEKGKISSIEVENIYNYSNLDQLDDGNSHLYERVKPRDPKNELYNQRSNKAARISRSSNEAAGRKGRNRKVRYHPNLVSIPESEQERHTQKDDVSSRDNVNLLNRILNLESGGGLKDEIISEDQFNALVKNAMSQTCSHLVQRMHDNMSQTLFSKPIGDGNLDENPVSRSRILKQSKQDS